MAFAVPVDPNVAGALYGTNVATANAGFQNQMNTLSGISYSLPDPKEGFMAKVFPSDGRWHRLYNHSRTEVFDEFYNISTGVPESEKPATIKKLGDIVIESTIVRYNSYVYKLLIATVILVIIIVLTGVEISLWIPVIMAIIAGIMLLFNEYYFRPDSETKWQETLNTFNAAIKAGKMPDKMRDQLAQQDFQDRQIEAMQNAPRGNTGNSFVAGLAGGLVSGLFKK